GSQMPTLPLLPLPPLSSGNPSAHPQPTIQSPPASWHPLSPPLLINHSLFSTMPRQSTSSTGLPCPSSSALVSHRPSAASGLHSFGCTS
ncbi:hypothetical protein M9458_026285, partial [Cirrhinus mrigala]